MCIVSTENDEPRVTVEDKGAGVFSYGAGVFSYGARYGCSRGGGDNTKALLVEDVGSFHPEPTMVLGVCVCVCVGGGGGGGG